MDAVIYATEIVKKLVHAGYIAYFAGGWVRDYVMDQPSTDIDIATSAPPPVILDLFPKTIQVGLHFGVVIVACNSHQFEVATFRKDVGGDGRRPEKIEMTTAQEDATRRDFTINGLFFDPIEKKIYDFVNGIEDIEKGIIRTIGSPFDRFVEDRLRMIRAIRFAAKFGFSIDRDTQEAIAENADTLFPSVAMERLWQEFVKMSDTPHFDHALVEMRRLNLLQVIFPILEGVHLQDIKKRVSSFVHMPKESTPTVLYLFELFPDIDLEGIADICQMLRISVRERKIVEYAWWLRQAIIGQENDRVKLTHLYANPLFKICFPVVLARYGDDLRFELLQRHEKMQMQLKRHVERVAHKKPLITAALLSEEGIAPGVVMGKLLKDAERLSIENNLDDPCEVMKLLQRE